MRLQSTGNTARLCRQSENKKAESKIGRDDNSPDSNKEHAVLGEACCGFKCITRKLIWRNIYILSAASDKNVASLQQSSPLFD